MFEAYVPGLLRAGRSIAMGLAVVAAVLGVWMLLNPASARSWLHGVRTRLEAGKAGPILLATGVQNGGYFQIGAELASAAKGESPYSVEVQESGGSLDNLKRLREGKANFALVQGGLISNPAVDAASPAEMGILPIANVDRQYVHLVVPVDSPIRSVHDLAGKRVGVGPAGSGHEALARLVMGYMDYSPAPQLVTDHSPNLEEAFQTGAIDASFSVYSLFSPAMEELLDSGNFRLVPMPEAGAIARFLPGVYAEELPPSLYGPDRAIPPVVDGPFPVLMVNTYLVARQDVSAGQVRALLEALYSPRFRFSAHLPDLDEQHGRISPLAPLHPEAVAWYARHEPLSVDRFEVGSFFLAGLVTLASTVQYLIGRRHWLRGVRSRRMIQPYFERLLEYGDAAEATRDTSALNAILHDMMATQREAERDWLSGQLQTEDMENLYLIYNTRTRNAFDKIHQLHLQALIEGAPVPATYHPEPVQAPMARPAAVAAPVTPPRTSVETFFAPDAEQVVAEVVPAPAPMSAPSPTPSATSGVGVARPQKTKKHKHRQEPSSPQPQQAKPAAPAVVPAPTPTPVVTHAAPVITTPAAQPAPAPRKLEDWEIEQKYQRSADYAADFDSGIVSAPRPRRVQASSDAPAPARAELTEEEKVDPQLEMF